MEKSHFKGKERCRLKEYFFRQMEGGWNDRFTVLYSKDNGRFHKTQREYFGSEKRFDRFYRDRFEEVAALERVKSRGKVGKIVSSLSQRSLGTQNKLSLPELSKGGITVKKKVSVLDYNYLSCN